MKQPTVPSPPYPEGPSEIAGTYEPWHNRLAGKITRMAPHNGGGISSSSTNTLIGAKLSQKGMKA